MFGYLKPDKPYLYMKDDVLYRALYCGVCKSIGQNCGQIARFTLTYDIAFLSAICHNILGKDIKINKERCITHIIKKIPVAASDEISLMLADVNLILAYYKLIDDVLDEKKGGLKTAVFKRAYKKAKKRLYSLDEYILNQTKILHKLEKENSDSVDMVADSSANILVEISKTVLKDKSNEYTDGFFYAVGKWIYLIDALDDYDKDVKSKSFNVFYNAYRKDNFNALINDCKNEIIFIFNGIFYQISENFKNIEMQYNTDLVKNIVTRGIPLATDKILNKNLKGSKNER